jgi:hypothetical protein
MENVLIAFGIVMVFSVILFIGLFLILRKIPMGTAASPPRFKEPQ